MITCSAPATRTSSSSRSSDPGRSHMRCVSPRHGPSAGSRTRCGSVATGMRQARGQRVHRRGRGRRQPDRTPPPAGAVDRPDVRRSAGDADRVSRPEDDVAPGVHVVRDHQQLAKSGLTKVLEQQTPDTSVRARRVTAPRSTPHRESGSTTGRRRDRAASPRTAATRAGARHVPGRSAARAGARKNASASAPRQRAQRDEQAQHDQPRNDRGQRGRLEQGIEPACYRSRGARRRHR